MSKYISKFEFLKLIRNKFMEDKEVDSIIREKITKVFDSIDGLQNIKK